MAFKYKRFTTETTEVEKIENEYCIEIGTYLPIAKRVEDLKKAGMDLMAYRQAYAEFANGTQDIDLDEYDNELLGIDEIDFLEKRKKYFDIMKAQEKAVNEYQEELLRQKREEEINSEVEKRVKGMSENKENV